MNQGLDIFLLAPMTELMNVLRKFEYGIELKAACLTSDSKWG